MVEDQDRDGKREVLEVLTDTEEIGSEVVLKQEVLDVVLHLGGATVGVVLQARAIADLGVELHTGGEGLIILHFGDDVVGHSVIHAPWHEALPAAEDTIVKARVFTEDRATVGNESHRRLGIGDGFDRGKRKVHILAFCCKDMDERGSGKRRGGVYKQWNTLLITQNYGLEIHGNSCAVTCIVKIKFGDTLSMHK